MGFVYYKRNRIKYVVAFNKLPFDANDVSAESKSFELEHLQSLVVNVMEYM